MTQDVEPRSRRRAPGPPGLYGVRNLVRFARDQLVFLRELADAHGDVVEMKFLGAPVFLVSHPDDVEAVLVKHARVMLRDEYVVVLERALGKGLLTSDGELWKRQRKRTAQAFVPKRIRSYGDAMVRVTEAAVRPWRDGQTINLHQEISRVTMEVVSDVLFGAGIGHDGVRTVSESMAVVNEYLANSPEAILKLPGWVPTPRNIAVNRAVKRIDDLLYGIIARRRDGAPVDDLLGTLLSAQDDDGARMSDRELRDEAITLFLAGHETTALLLAHTFYLLSKHPDVERRLHAEVASVLGGRPPTADDVRALPYAERVLKETMRLYPPAWVTGREAGEDVEVGGYVIPKGAQILLSQWVVHRDPRWFPNPEGFDPDRWTPDRAGALPRYAYFPFGGGPRVCIGNHFAVMEATLILAIIVQRFRIELLPGQRLVLEPSVTLRQAGPGLRVRLVEREAAGRARVAPAAGSVEVAG
jgi:cytochrome P450